MVAMLISADGSLYADSCVGRWGFMALASSIVSRVSCIHAEAEACWKGVHTVQAWGITNELALNEQSRVVISIWR
jgi:hypothetical protein